MTNLNIQKLDLITCTLQVNFLKLFYYVYVCKCGEENAEIWVWASENYLQDDVIYFHAIGSRNQTQFFGLMATAFMWWANLLAHHLEFQC